MSGCRGFGLIAILGMLALAAAGCGRASGTPPGAGAQQQSPWQATKLWVEQDDQTRPFENGTALAVGDVTVEIFVAPYPPLREGSIDFYVTDGATGKPVEGGLKIIFDMYMPHGSIRADALSTGGGHFLVPYKLVMPGEWRADITIARGGDAASLAVIFRVD